MDRLEVVAYLRTLIGTPFGHQGRGSALDCIGLAYVVAEKFNLADTDMTTKKAEKYIGYSRFPSNGLLRKACNEYLVKIPCSDMQPADLYLMDWGVRTESHIALLTDTDTIIHALSRPGVRKVAEHELDAVWRGRRAGCYRFPGLV